MDWISSCPELLAAATAEPHPAILLPFAALLFSIALMPFFHKHWWERHYPKVSLVLSAVTIAYYVLVLKNPGRMLHVAHEYISFIALIGSLFLVSSGIHIRVKGAATPAFNCAFLFVGALLSNIIGTTGASMLLLRPWIRLNRHRITQTHIVFFIFIVSNIGGCLTPIGDPPLFLGYLKGVPFLWVLKTCWPAWVIGVLGLISLFYFLDHRSHAQTGSKRAKPESDPEGWKVEGLRNLGFLALILVGIFLRSPPGLSEVLMIGAAVGSYFATPKQIHDSNEFNLHPLREVGWLFIGIFATMVPALDYLELHAKEMGLSSAMAFFWLTGGLSAALDNAPTYLTFLAAAMGLHDLSLNDPTQVLQLIAHHDRELIAISLGAVFFGAMTYIGNGPNFMVKAIAEHSQVKTPGFLAYLLQYALPILLPLFILISLLFFSRWQVF